MKIQLRLSSTVTRIEKSPTGTTPHCSWIDRSADRSVYDVFDNIDLHTRHRHMIIGGKRYIPSFVEVEWKRSIYDVKTVLVKNEKDDGRPILYYRYPHDSRVISIMGGRIGNIYDLFHHIQRSEPQWARPMIVLFIPPL